MTSRKNPHTDVRAEPGPGRWGPFWDNGPKIPGVIPWIPPPTHMARVHHVGGWLEPDVYVNSGERDLYIYIYIYIYQMQETSKRVWGVCMDNFHP